MKVVPNRKKFFALSSLVVLLSLSAVLIFGLKLSIEFAGGDLFELQPPQKAQKTQIESILNAQNITDFSLRETEGESGAMGYVLRTRSLSEDQKIAILNSFKANDISVLRSASVGPIVGNELKKKAEVAIFVTVIIIILFVAYAFREVSKPVSSWKYGFVAILALVHDIIIPLGVFAVLGQYMNAQVDVLFVMALLAILGYSVNDTIVIFDRVRERLKFISEKKIKEDFSDTVEKALKSTMPRSLNTSLTTVITLMALFLLGADSTKYFALTLLAGVVAGTYSSIFLAGPILVELAKRNKK